MQRRRAVSQPGKHLTGRVAEHDRHGVGVRHLQSDRDLPGAHDYTTGSTNSNGYNTYLANNCWGDPNCQQTLSANSFGDWRVTANEPAGNGSVRTAPEGQQQFNNWCPGSKNSGATWSRTAAEAPRTLRSPHCPS